MFSVERIGSYITRGVYTVSGPFHPFGGAVDIIVVEQQDGSFKTSPWYVRFGKFQGVLKTKEKVVNINVNGVDADFHMYLDHKGEAYFLKEVEVEEGESVLYQSSSGEDTDGQSNGRRPMKSKSCNYDATELNSGSQIDVENVKIVARTGSRRARLLGLVFGRKSNSFREEEGDLGMVRASSLERAEIAADLLEVKWSTNLTTNRPAKDKGSRFSAADLFDSEVDKGLQINGEEIQVSPTMQDSMEKGRIRESGFEESECFAEETSTQSSARKEDFEMSTFGGKNLEEQVGVISVLSIDPSSKASVVNAEYDERAMLSGNGKELDERDVLSCHSVSDETEMVRVQSFEYCETSESSRLGLHGFGGQTKETLHLSHGVCEEVCVHAEILHETTENLSEVSSQPVSGILVAKESSNNVDNLRDVDNEMIIESEVKFMNSVGHNIDTLSSVDIHLITSNSVEKEELGFIHQGTITKRNADDINTETEVWEVPGDHSRLANSCTSCVFDYDGVEFNEPAVVPESYTPTVKTELILGSIKEAELQSIGTVFGFSNLVHQVKEVNDDITDENDGADIKRCQGLNISPSESSEEEQFLFSDLDDLKLREVQCIESISPDLVEGIDLHSHTLVGTEAVNESSSINYESRSSSDKCVQENLPNDVEDLVEKPRQMSHPIEILGCHEFGGERGGRMVESLPDLWSHANDLGAHDLRHPCHSLDLDTKLSKWALLRKNASTFIKLDGEQEHQLAEGQLTTGDIQISGQLINVPFDPATGDSSKAIVASSGSWRMWPFPFKRSRSLAVQPELNNTRSSDVENGPESTPGMGGDKTELKPKVTKKKIRIITPTSEQLTSLNLKEGRNTVTFTFSTGMLGKQQVDARIYLWKWNTRIVISDVDGTITKSDVLGQFMPWVGVDWSQTGVAHLFSAIKKNGYQLLFLSARAISQAYLTRQFLFNLKQDGIALPDGPVVISPDGLFPSLFREVIRRAPHEFKIACLEDIKALFPSDCSPFYAGFGNRDTDEISYLKVGIPKGKIFIINPKGQVAVNRRVDTKSYPSLHALVHDMFPPMSSTEQEDFNSWNFWKLPPPVLNG